MSLSISNDKRTENINLKKTKPKQELTPKKKKEKMLINASTVMVGATALATIVLASISIAKKIPDDKLITLGERVLGDASTLEIPKMSEKYKNALNKLNVSMEMRNFLEFLKNPDVKMLKNGRVKITYGPEASRTRLCFDKQGKYEQKITMDAMGYTVYDAEDNVVKSWFKAHK